eukprot:jgi/Galph1/1936/GphlegSOOS_G599.1
MEEASKQVEKDQTRTKIEKIFDDLEQKIHHVDTQLATLTNKLDSKHARQASLMELLETQLWDVETEATELNNKWQGFIKELEYLSKPLNLFYLKTSRLEETKNILETAIKLRSIFAAFQSAFKQGNLKQAVEYASQLRDLEKEPTFQAESVQKLLKEQPSYRYELESLKESLRHRIKEARSTGPDALLSLYDFSLDLYKVGAEEEAFEGYLSFLMDLIEKEMHQLLETLPQTVERSGKAAGKCISSITHLYECVASYIADNQYKFEQDWVNKGLAYRMICKLQSVCDEYSCIILDTYRKCQQLETIAENLESKSVDVKHLDSVMDQVAVISQRTAAYFNFIQQKLEYLEEVSSHHSTNMRTDTTLLRDCLLRRKLEELISVYISMENFYMMESLKKAIALDETSYRADVLDSAFVDDCYFVIQKSVKRASSFDNADVFCAIINEVSDVISRQLYAFLKKRLQKTISAANQKTPNRNSVDFMQTKATVKNKHPYQFLIRLVNNLQSCNDYSKRLMEWLESTSRKSSGWLPHEWDKIHSVLADLKDTFKQFHWLYEEALEHLKSSITSKLSRSVESFQQVSFMIQEVDTTDIESYSPFPSFLEQVDKVFTPLEDMLLEYSWDQLTRQVALWVTHQLESLLWHKRFNASGAFEIDNVVRSITHYFNGKMKQGTVRDIFTRLFQLIILLNVESPTEVYEMWDGGEEQSIHWKLTEEEVRKVLSLRTEFSRESIQNLAL